MDERRLGVFVAVARELSFSRAGALLHLSQPAVSQQVAALEADIGARLVERNRRAVRLTEAGRLFLARAEPILRDLREARREVAAASGAVQGDLQITASLTVGEYVLPPVLARFGALYPHVRLHVAVENTERVARALLAGGADVGFVEGRVSVPGLDVQPFREDELVVVAAAGHPWGRRRSIRLEDLLAEPMVLREQGSGTRQVAEEHLRAAGVDLRDLRVVMELAGIEAIKTAVEAGIGVSILSRSAIAKELRLHSLVACPLRGLPMRRTMAWARVSGRVELPAVRELLALVRAAGAASGTG